MNIVKSIDKYYKKQDKKYSKILSNDYIVEFDKINMDLIHFFTDEQKELSAKYSFYGIINQNMKFIWSTKIYGFNNQEMHDKINEIKQKKNIFKGIDNKKAKFYYKLLSNDTIDINDDTDIVNINKLMLYMSKGKFMINPMNSNNFIQMIGINKIKEKYF